MNLKALFALFCFLSSFHAYAQLQGTVTNTNAETLPFASIYVEGTSIGTTTNDEGVFLFDLEPGTYKIVFQYVGYKQKVEQISLTSKPLKIDVTLESESVDIVEVVIKANAEDPAYAIIRKSIAKRDYYRERVKSFSCDVYIKGNQKLMDAPEKIFGQEIGDLGGSLDSNRQGIVYLSESQAKLYSQRPDQVKEHMISSKVSGNDNGFGFNRASMMDFNFYENHIVIACLLYTSPSPRD